MEDLWRVQDSEIDLEKFADSAVYRRFIERFCDDEEKEHRQRLLYGEERIR